MAKKLRVEVDADTKKAKQKLKELADGTVGGGADTVASSADRAARALDRATKSVRGLDDVSNDASVNMRRVVRGFAGIAAGMAASYAANHMEQGAARNAVEVGGAAVAGASSGMMIGSMVSPGVGTVAGAVIGGAIGGGMKAFDQSAERDKYIKDFETGERRYESAKEWKATLDGLTDVGKGADALAEKLAAARAELEKYQSAEAGIRESIVKFAEKGQFDNANHQQQSLAGNRARQEQLQSIVKSLEKGLENAAKTPRTTTEALDALSRIGGNFGGGDLARDQLRTQQEMAATLKSIDQKAANGGGIWQ